MNFRSARVIQVIEVTVLEGEGTTVPPDPYHISSTYLDLAGNVLARRGWKEQASAVAEEREACAALCDREAALYRGGDPGGLLIGLREYQAKACERNAAAIRARGNQ